MVINSIIFIISAYLLGSAPHLKWLARWRQVNLEGDFHSSLWNKAGKPIAVMGIMGEFVKGASPIVISYWLGFDLMVVATGGLAAVCGQMWPIWSKFNGEKGNTVGLAMATALATTAMIIAIIPIVIGVFFRTVPRLINRAKSPDNSIIGGTYSRSLPIAMMACFLVLPLASLWLKQPIEIVISGLILLAIILIRRLTAGLGYDLKTKVNKSQILKWRLFYDRGVSRNTPF